MGRSRGSHGCGKRGQESSARPPRRDSSSRRGNTHGRVCRMNLDTATELVRQTLILAMVVSAPMLIIGLVVGIAISLFQAVTQIQEQTLTFIPKIVSMIAAAIVLMPWIAHRLLEYTATMFQLSF
jgi:flagellar biosynthetic protein FliQ